MPLLTDIEKINLGIVRNIQGTIGLMSQVAQRMNQLGDDLLKLGDVELADWLNSHDPEELQALLGAHRQISQVVNICSGLMRDVASAANMPVNCRVADPRPFLQRLEVAGRVGSVDADGKWSISPLPVSPPPVHEPTPPSGDLPPEPAFPGGVVVSEESQPQ